MTEVTSVSGALRAFILLLFTFHMFEPALIAEGGDGVIEKNDFL